MGHSGVVGDQVLDPTNVQYGVVERLLKADRSEIYDQRRGTCFRLYRVSGACR